MPGTLNSMRVDPVRVSGGAGSALLERTVGSAGGEVVDSPCAILGHLRASDLGPARARSAIVTEVR